MGSNSGRTTNYPDYGLSWLFCPYKLQTVGCLGFNASHCPGWKWYKFKVLQHALTRPSGPYQCRRVQHTTNTLTECMLPIQTYMVSVATVFTLCANRRAMWQCKFQLVWLLPILMCHSKGLQRDGLTACTLKHECQLAATHRQKKTVQP